MTEDPSAVKPVRNDHLYNKIEYLWFIQQCVLMMTEGTNLPVLTISAFLSSSRWPSAQEGREASNWVVVIYRFHCIYIYCNIDKRHERIPKAVIEIMIYMKAKLIPQFPLDDNNFIVCITFIIVILFVVLKEMQLFTGALTPTVAYNDSTDSVMIITWQFYACYHLSTLYTTCLPDESL